MAAGLLAVAAFMTVTPYKRRRCLRRGRQLAGRAKHHIGMIIGLVVAELFTFVIRRTGSLPCRDSVPSSVSRSFSALIPGFLILSIFGIVSWLLASYGSTFHQIIMDSISAAGGDG
ncbi:PTS system N,N'-diacetylchitobiose-specific EIIC component [Raoultella terrigena]|uniref:PTS system N,N'-diacetylchitobiose-specific EIIC component n=1 Tax=Raoultella terrigena TaxID=577 RepID=A0A3P8JX50_RAOTE|nr:PTS system N,N'-diacetylchitobiose-specific EIIC component [Raoultella terrigena]